MGSPAYQMPPRPPPPPPPDDLRARMDVLETSFAWFQYEIREKLEALRTQLAEISKAQQSQHMPAPAPEPVNAALSKVMAGLMAVFATLVLTGSAEKARDIGLKLLLMGH